MKKTVVVLILCVSLLTVGCAGVLTKAETPAQKIAYVETSYFALVKSIADAVQIGEITQAQGTAFYVNGILPARAALDIAWDDHRMGSNNTALEQMALASRILRIITSQLTNMRR